ncbi:DUF664 domain-containing protein [Glycomyces buryatensis]|uniref:DUF664 domain-containing protein n=1 Tax=Glycomyces buryatensis TaxID=2570927 RepID=A0A4V6T6R5_9ACTN|nr:DUF664 domain-containing protein [Glycomyces buryatensis]THV42406.1 DUF664 domain-containing protein [Glycomyces buryatensis]
MTDTKARLHRDLRNARESLLWKLDGLGEYDLRRPMTPTGTNLLGLVKRISGTAGLRPDFNGLPEGDEGWWSDYRDRLEQAADKAAGQ